MTSLGSNTASRGIDTFPITKRASSTLIDMGFSAVAIANRVGHESIDITYRYAHMFPSKQTEMADRLDAAKEANTYVAEES